MIIGLLRKIEAHLAEIVRLLKTPEDFTAEDGVVRQLTKDAKDATKSVEKAKERIPSGQGNP